MRRFALWLFLAALWIPLFAALAPSWGGETYYSYGWLAPFAIVFFFLRRNRDAPSVNCKELALPPTIVALFSSGILVLCVLRILEGGNVHWRLPLWLHGGTVVVMSVLVLFLLEGLGAARRYLPAFLFLAFSIPLPSSVEQFLIGYLTETVSSTGADLAILSGTAVEKSEAAFLIEGETLDVNDGCSGIRSFQSSLFASYFVGELFLLALPARVTLLLVGIGAAMLGNTARIVALIKAYDSGGREKFDTLHDTVGFVSLLLAYGLIILAGVVFDHRESLRSVYSFRSKTSHQPTDPAVCSERGETANSGSSTQ